MFGPDPVTLPERCEYCGRVREDVTDEIVDGEGYMCLCRPCRNSMARRQDLARREAA
jgi:hypothetical protein